jgi:hypothetical protein
MGVRIKPKRSETSSSTPGTSDIEVGEIAVNITDQKIFIRKSDDSIVELANASGIGDVVDDTSPQLGGNLDLNGNDIVSTSNADIDIIPNGTGDINLGADTVQVGDNNANATITTQGTGDLILNTNNGTNSGTISILDGANGNITITPNGSGNVVLDGLSFPNSDGSAGQFLKTDGSAALSFASVTSSFTKMDAITTDGSTAYTLNVSSSAFTSATTNGTIVSVNGVTQAPVDAYSISGSTITFTESLSSDDVIDYIIAIDTQDIGTPGDGTVTAAKLDTGLKSFTEDTFTGDGSDTTFTLSVAPPSDTSIMVFLDGVSQPAGNYSVSSTTLTFTTAPPNNVAIRVLHLGFTASVSSISDGSVTSAKLDSGLKTFTEDTFTGDGSDTTFTLSVAPPSDTSILVSVSGVIQPAGNYSVSSTTLTFTTAPPLNAAIRVLHLGFTGSSASITDGAVTSNKLATGLKTFTEDKFTGDNSTTAFTLSQIPPNTNAILVTVDGIVQPVSAYSVSGTTLTMSAAPATDSTLRALHLGLQTTVGSVSDNAIGYAKIDKSELFARRAWENKTSDFTAVAGGAYLIDVSSAAVTITLPASPSLGDEVRLIDAAGNSGTNNITVGRNSQKINGNAEDLTVSTDSAAFSLVYYNSTNGWRYTEV